MRHIVTTKRNSTIEHHFEFDKSDEGEYMDSDLCIARCNRQLGWLKGPKIDYGKFEVELFLNRDGCIVYLRSR